MDNHIRDIDMVLEFLYNNPVLHNERSITSNISDKLLSHTFPSNLHVMIYKKLERDGFVDIKTEGDDKYYNISFEGVQFYQKGGYVADIKKRKSQAFWKSVENMPKRFWFVSIFLASLGFNARDLIKSALVKWQQKPKIESSQRSQQRDTNQTHRAF